MKSGPRVEGAETKINWNEYEMVSPAALAYSKALATAWDNLGKPTSPFTPAGNKLMDMIIKVWEKGYPSEAKQWYADRAEYKRNEMSISDQVSKRTGRSLASYPLPIYSMMKKLFIGFDPAQRNNCLKIVKKWPMFLMANKA